MKCIFSIDVEDWFHILDLPTVPKLLEWDSLPLQVERDFQTLLEIMDRHEVKSTCFFLGWVAKKFPHLVRQAAAAGHEIASHGYAHDLVYELTREQFAADIRKSKDVIEQAAGCTVKGYRAPGFSITEVTPWVYEELLSAGYRYSSSEFPAARGHGGIRGGRLNPYLIEEAGDVVAEFPISVAEGFGKRICLFGGGYLRLFPSFLIKSATNRLLASGRPVNFYIHPREINPHHPRLPMSAKRRFKTYVNLKSTKPKLEALFSRYEFETFSDYLSANWLDLEVIGKSERQAQPLRKLAA